MLIVLTRYQRVCNKLEQLELEKKLIESDTPKKEIWKAVWDLKIDQRNKHRREFLVARQEAIQKKIDKIDNPELNASEENKIAQSDVSPQEA